MTIADATMLLRGLLVKRSANLIIHISYLKLTDCGAVDKNTQGMTKALDKGQPRPDVTSTRTLVIG